MEITDGITFNEIIENYLLEFQENASVKEVVYHIVKDNLINKKALRNRCIVKDFDIAIKGNNKSLTEIYDNLCYKYNLSNTLIRNIIAIR